MHSPRVLFHVLYIGWFLVDTIECLTWKNYIRNSMPDVKTNGPKINKVEHGSTSSHKSVS